MPPKFFDIPKSQPQSEEIWAKFFNKGLEIQAQNCASLSKSKWSQTLMFVGDTFIWPYNDILEYSWYFWQIHVNDSGCQVIKHKKPICNLVNRIV